MSHWRSSRNTWNEAAAGYACAALVLRREHSAKRDGAGGHGERGQLPCSGRGLGASFPVPVVARRVQHGNDRHNVASDGVNDSIWKGARKGPANLPLAFAKPMAQ